jgi:hypothetical protein
MLSWSLRRAALPLTLCGASMLAVCNAQESEHFESGVELPAGSYVEQLSDLHRLPRVRVQAPDGRDDSVAEEGNNFAYLDMSANTRQLPAVDVWRQKSWREASSRWMLDRIGVPPNVPDRLVSEKTLVVVGMWGFVVMAAIIAVIMVTLMEAQERRGQRLASSH